MLDIERKIAVEGSNDALIVVKWLSRHRSDELSGVRRHNHMHVGMQLNEHRGQIGALVGSNSGNTTSPAHSL